MLNAIIRWHRQRETERQLGLLSDRELADIGIERADIAQIASFDPAAEKRSAAVQTRRSAGRAFRQAPSRA